MNDGQLLRYSRHLFLPELDVVGQQKLLDSHALIIGAGGLGCPAAMYLASSGVGTITLADDDEVELSNLQRQIAHGERDIGRPKVESLQQSLQQMNSTVTINALIQRLSSDELTAMVRSVDVVLDCTDNFDSRFAINRACVAEKTPLVSGAAIRFDAQLQVFDFRQDDTPCYRCLFQEQQGEQPRCSETGVLAPVVGVVGAWQALETIKLLADIGELQSGLKVMDFKNANEQTLKLRKDPACPVCGENNSENCGGNNKGVKP